MLKFTGFAVKAAVVATSIGMASSASAAITVLHTWDLEGTAGNAAADPAVDSTGSIDLTKVGSFNHVNTSTAGTGVDFANAGGNLSVAANNYYENTTDTITLADRFNWGFEAVVKLNALPATVGDVHGETALVELGTGGNRVILQTFNSELGGTGTPNWMIHIAGLSLIIADPAQGGALVVGQEQHIAAVFNQTTWELYVDGALVPLTAPVGSTGSALNSPLTGVRIGAADNAGNILRGLDGAVGAVRVFEFEQGAFDIGDTLIPEPASVALLGLGGLLMLRRRR